MQSVSPSHVESEDCLYLNVWSPTRQMRSLPVMVFIHGGAFKQGGASTALYDPSDLARRGVVAVTLNYRLGAFGFLVSLSDGVVGNAGLWDQQLALGWVHRNIAQFGGDASRVGSSKACLFSPMVTMFSANKPCLTALRFAQAFPFSVLGPVLLLAFC